MKAINTIFRSFWFQIYIICLYWNNFWPQNNTPKKSVWVWPQNDLTSYLSNYWFESPNVRTMSFSGQNNPVYQILSRSEIWGLTSSWGLSWICPIVPYEFLRESTFKQAQYGVCSVNESIFNCRSNVADYKMWLRHFE